MASICFNSVFCPILVTINAYAYQEGHFVRSGPSGDDRGTRPPGLAGHNRLRPTVLSRNDNGSLQVADRTTAASPRLCGSADRGRLRRGGAEPDAGDRTPGFRPSPAGHRIAARGLG